MKKFSTIAALVFFAVTATVAHADKDQVLFTIQKVKANINKVQTKSDDSKMSIAELDKARDYLKQAETELNRNKTLLGSLKKAAEPGILHLTELAEIELAIASARLEMASQEKENRRLEALIPTLESQIKVFEDKNAEIRRLKEEIAKPKTAAKGLDKPEREKLAGKLEALNEVVASLRKDANEKVKVISNLTAENKVLKENMSALEKQKGSDIVAMQTRLTSAEARLKTVFALGSLGFFSRVSENEWTLIVPRGKLVKTSSKSYALAPDAQLYIGELVEAIKSAPGSRVVVKAHGFGKPAAREDRRATDTIAKLVKGALVSGGVSESAIESTGMGPYDPLFSKGAVDENRCIEITIRQ